jgi:hypothetical protein
MVDQPDDILTHLKRFPATRIKPAGTHVADQCKIAAAFQTLAEIRVQPGR